jgi:hypothetical protein
MKEVQLSMIDNFVFLHINNNPFAGINERKILLVNANDIRHEGFLSRFDEVRGKIGDIHVAPFEWKDHAHQGLDDQSG